MTEPTPGLRRQSPKDGLHLRMMPSNSLDDASSEQRVRLIWFQQKTGISWDDLYFLNLHAAIAQLNATDKYGTISEIVESLARVGAFPQEAEAEIVAALLKREELASTGLGRGVAVPHTRHPAVERLIGTIAFSTDGIDFGSLDGEPVHVVFLLVSPPHGSSEHLRALEKISRLLRGCAPEIFSGEYHSSESV